MYSYWVGFHDYECIARLMEIPCQSYKESLLECFLYVPCFQNCLCKGGLFTILYEYREMKGSRWKTVISSNSTNPTTSKYF